MSTRTRLITTFIALSSLTGCHLYLGEGEGEGDRDQWNDCPDCSSSPDFGPQPDGNTGNTGWECEENSDCAAGCFCAGSECEEGGFCELDTDCADDFTCDGRSSCVPPQAPEPTCQGELTNCYVAQPICSADTTGVIVDGCYTGACMPKSECPDGPPLTCSDHADEASCGADENVCLIVYKGINCTSPSGAECTSGMTDCSCESFAFDRCEVP